jgi:transposase
MSKDFALKLENLKKKKEALDARIQKLSASAKSRERKIDTRKKILIGSYYLDKAVKENTFSEIVHLMNSFLTRDSDRKVFNLTPIKEEK